MAGKLEIQQRFVEEGRFVALPLGVTDESLPIPAGESRITTFAETDDRRRFYGATRGECCHLFGGGARGVTGGILDLGVLEQIQEVAAIAVVQTELRWRVRKVDTVVCAGNHPEGSTVYRFDNLYPADTIQEPSYSQPEIQVMARWGCQVYDAFLTSDKQRYICLCSDGIRVLDLETLDISQHQVDLSNALLKRWLHAGDASYFMDGSGVLQPYEAACSLTTPSVTAPADASAACCWDGKIIVATAHGDIHLLDPLTGSANRIGQAPLPGVQCMATLRDGRLYGVCGADIGFFFRMDLRTGDSEALGAIATTLGTTRYGFEFSEMVVGSDGEIYMLENDRGGHLWVYFPPQPTM